MMDDAPFVIIWSVAILAVLALCVLIGTTTHESHMKQLETYNQQMGWCIQSDRSAADCRVMVYGSE